MRMRARCMFAKRCASSICSPCELDERQCVVTRQDRGNPTRQSAVRDEKRQFRLLVNRAEIVAQAEVRECERPHAVLAPQHQRQDQHEAARRKDCAP